MNKIFKYLRGDEYTENPNGNVPKNKNLIESLKLFLKYLGKILKLLFPKFACAATLLFIILLIDVVALEFVVYQVGLFSGRYFKVLSSKDLDAFWPLALTSIAYIILNAFMKSIKDFIASLLSIVWRKYLTLSIHEQYFTNKNFYYLQHQSQWNEDFNRHSHHHQTESLTIQLEHGHNPNTEPILNSLTSDQPNQSLKPSILDNPDQRITQDVNSLCVSIANIVPLILISPFVIGWYGYQVYFKTMIYKMIYNSKLPLKDIYDSGIFRSIGCICLFYILEFDKWSFDKSHCESDL